jgi:hypothetical protein
MPNHTVFKKLNSMLVQKFSTVYPSQEIPQEGKGKI